MVDFDPSSWLTEGGVDNQPVALRNVKFEKDVEYQDGQEPYLSVDIVPLDGETTPFEGQRLGIGKGWDEAEDGSSITRSDGKKLAYNTQSKAGRIVGSLMGIKEFQEAVKARWDGGDQVTPFMASFFEGITGTIHSNSASFKAKDSGEEISYTYYTFEDFTGYEGAGSGAGAGAAKPVAKKSARKKAAAKPAEVVTETPAEGNNLADLTARLLDHARGTSAETHDEWMLEAYDTFADDLTTDEAAALVEDPANVWDVICAEG